MRATRLGIVSGWARGDTPSNKHMPGQLARSELRDCVKKSSAKPCPSGTQTDDAEPAASEICVLASFGLGLGCPDGGDRPVGEGSEGPVD
eukprot:3043601-Pyramimonas_sp.AAC.1